MPVLSPNSQLQTKEYTKEALKKYNDPLPKITLLYLSLLRISLEFQNHLHGYKAKAGEEVENSEGLIESQTQWLERINISISEMKKLTTPYSFSYADEMALFNHLQARANELKQLYKISPSVAPVEKAQNSNSSFTVSESCFVKSLNELNFEELNNYYHSLESYKGSLAIGLDAIGEVQNDIEKLDVNIDLKKPIIVKVIRFIADFIRDLARSLFFTHSSDRQVLEDEYHKSEDIKQVVISLQEKLATKENEVKAEIIKRAESFKKIGFSEQNIENLTSEDLALFKKMEKIVEGDRKNLLALDEEEYEQLNEIINRSKEVVNNEIKNKTEAKLQELENLINKIADEPTALSEEDMSNFKTLSDKCTEDQSYFPETLIERRNSIRLKLVDSNQLINSEIERRETEKVENFGKFVEKIISKSYDEIEEEEALKYGKLKEELLQEQTSLSDNNRKNFVEIKERFEDKSEQIANFIHLIEHSRKSLVSCVASVKRLKDKEKDVYSFEINYLVEKLDELNKNKTQFPVKMRGEVEVLGKEFNNLKDDIYSSNKKIIKLDYNHEADSYNEIFNQFAAVFDETKKAELIEEVKKLYSDLDNEIDPIKFVRGYKLLSGFVQSRLYEGSVSDNNFKADQLIVKLESKFTLFKELFNKIKKDPKLVTKDDVKVFRNIAQQLVSLNDKSNSPLNACLNLPKSYLTQLNLAQKSLRGFIKNQETVEKILKNLSVIGGNKDDLGMCLTIVYIWGSFEQRNRALSKISDLSNAITNVYEKNVFIQRINLIKSFNVSRFVSAGEADKIDIKNMINSWLVELNNVMGKPDFTKDRAQQALGILNFIKSDCPSKDAADLQNKIETRIEKMNYSALGDLLFPFMEDKKIGFFSQSPPQSPPASVLDLKKVVRADISRLEARSSELQSLSDKSSSELRDLYESEQDTFKERAEKVAEVKKNMLSVVDEQAEISEELKKAKSGLRKKLEETITLLSNDADKVRDIITSIIETSDDFALILGTEKNEEIKPTVSLSLQEIVGFAQGGDWDYLNRFLTAAMIKNNMPKPEVMESEQLESKRQSL